MENINKRSDVLNNLEIKFTDCPFPNMIRSVLVKDSVIV